MTPTSEGATLFTVGYVYALFIGIFVGVLITRTQVDLLRDKVKKLEDMKGISWIKKRK